MIVLAFVFVAFAFLGLHSGFTNGDPRTELSAALTGKVPSGGSSARPPGGNVLPGKDTGAGIASPGSPTVRAGRLVMLPPGVCAARIPLHVDASIKQITIWCADNFGVVVTSGYRPGGGSLHAQGVAVDFGGTLANQRALYNYALTAGWGVEPWKDSHTIGKNGTTGSHVHISFIHPPGVY